MKKFITLLIIGFIFIGMGCGLMFYQILNGGIDLRPIRDFIREIINYEIRIEHDHLEITRPDH